MKKILLLSVMLLAAAAVLTSCKKDKEEDTFTNTVVYQYSGQTYNCNITKVVQTYHPGGETSVGVDLEIYFTDPGGSEQSFFYETFCPSGSTRLVAGTYSMNATNAPFSFSGESDLSGPLVITLTGDTYTIKASGQIDLETAPSSVTVSYKGAITLQQD